MASLTFETKGGVVLIAHLEEHWCAARRHSSNAAQHVKHQHKLLSLLPV